MGAIEIIEYREDWPARFEEVAAALRIALGEMALRIDHIGSTAVPGLAAKDIIDVQVTVAAFDDARLRDALHEHGFAVRDYIAGDHCPPGMTLPPGDLEKRFAVAVEPIRANVHLRVDGRFNQQYPLLCRDYLRAHPDAAAAYAEVKRALAQRFPHDVDSYYAVKDPVFDIIMSGAREWARANHW